MHICTMFNIVSYCCACIVIRKSEESGPCDKNRPFEIKGVAQALLASAS